MFVSRIPILDILKFILYVELPSVKPAATQKPVLADKTIDGNVIVHSKNKFRASLSSTV